MVTKIKTLTKEQWESVPGYIDNCLAQACTETNKSKAAASIADVYKNMNKLPPLVIWGRSPLEVIYFAAILKSKTNQLHDQLGDQLRNQLHDQLHDQLDGQLHNQFGNQLDGQLHDQLDDQLGDQLRNQLRSQLGDQFGNQFGNQLDGQLRNQLRSQLENQLHSQLRSQLRSQLGDQLDGQLHNQFGNQLHDQLDDQLGDQLRNQLHDQLHDQLDGQLDNQFCNQLEDQLRSQLEDQLSKQAMEVYQNTYTNIWWRRWSYYYLFAKDIGVNFNEAILESFCNLVNEVDCITAYNGIVFLSEKPVEVHWQDGRLHNELGASVQYKDGYSIYSITGIRLNEQIVIKPETLTITQIQSESNQEKRRIMIDRYGAGKYLEAINARLVDVDMRGIHGAGPRALMEEPNGNQWLVATDGSTNRVYHLFVGKGHQTCRQAHELLCGFSEDLIKAEG